MSSSGLMAVSIVVDGYKVVNMASQPTKKPMDRLNVASGSSVSVKATGFRLPSSEPMNDLLSKASCFHNLIPSLYSDVKLFVHQIITS